MPIAFLLQRKENIRPADADQQKITHWKTGEGEIKKKEKIGEKSSPDTVAAVPRGCYQAGRTKRYSVQDDTCTE
jgi:hypothetical protein